MATPSWQPGELYPNGSMVVPRTPLQPRPTALQNPGFEAGPAAVWPANPEGWEVTVEAGPGFNVAEVSAYNPFQGARNYSVDTNGGASRTDFEALNLEQPACLPGTVITLSCAMILAFDGASGGMPFLRWFDADGEPISDSDGILYRKPGDKSERWVTRSANGSAPARTASVRAGFRGYVEGDADLRFDNFTWSYNSAPPAEGLVFRAVQPEIGTSDTTEPVWPTVPGVQVVDGTVIWEGVLASRVVWEATAILKSGPTEPAWPLGGEVVDNTISWEATTRIVSDPNAPNSKVVAIMASKVFAVDRDLVRFSATANAQDWTTTEDAGYIGTGLQQANANDMAVLAPYRGNLAAFNASSFQLWQVDPDPSQMALLDQMEGIGSTWQHAAHPVGSELLYLSQLGVRSVGMAAGTNNLAAGDIGMPIDPLVQAAIAHAIASGTTPVATYYPSQGQYWLAFPDFPEAGTSTVFVATINAGKPKWSRYLFPFAIEAFAQLENDLYVRNGDQVSVVAEGIATDDTIVAGEVVAVPFGGTVWWPYLDFGQPGVSKMLEGLDVVASGAPSVRIGWDQRNLEAFTDPYAVDADTLPGGVVPISVSAPTMSIRVDFAPGTPWSLSSLLVYLSQHAPGS